MATVKDMKPATKEEIAPHAELAYCQSMLVHFQTRITLLKGKKSAISNEEKMIYEANLADLRKQDKVTKEEILEMVGNKPIRQVDLPTPETPRPVPIVTGHETKPEKGGNK